MVHTYFSFQITQDKDNNKDYNGGEYSLQDTTMRNFNDFKYIRYAFYKIEIMAQRQYFYLDPLLGECHKNFLVRF